MMKKLSLYISGQKIEIEIEEKFYKYIEKDIAKLNNSSSHFKEILSLMLSFAYKNYKNELKMTKLIKKLEL
jgi:hypothetical protein